MAKRGETRPYRIEVRWPGSASFVSATRHSLPLALHDAGRQARIVGGTTGERDCLVRVTDRRLPGAVLGWRRACPSCEELTEWDAVAREWRHVEPVGAYLCSDATRPERATEDPVEEWSR